MGIRSGYFIVWTTDWSKFNFAYALEAKIKALGMLKMF